MSVVYSSILSAVRPLTMVSDVGVAFTVGRAIATIEAGIAGELVECGVWKGGTSIAMLLGQRAAFGKVVRPVHMLDSFAGLPPADPDRDGPAAVAWSLDTGAPTYHDNCRASADALRAELDRRRFLPSEYLIWEGPFADTLPDLAVDLDAIALLRIDCDWYASVQPCLEALVPLCARGATVILDDYFAWDGCARAAHEFLARHDLPWRIRSLPDESAAYFLVS